MTFEQATAALLAAIEAEDLGAVAQALDQRQAAIHAALASGRQPPRDSVEEGNRACNALVALKHRWALESARLAQLRSGFVRPAEPGGSFHDCVG